MPLQESDISWQVLGRIVKDWAGAAAEIAEVKRLVGGCINLTLALTLADGARAVLKISPHRVNRDFEREASQLKLLESAGLPVPKIYACHTGSLDDPHSYLLMEFIDGVSLTAAKQACTPSEYDQLQQHLAELVAAIHSRTGDQYQRLLGPDLQAFGKWTDFYRHVYDPIWHDVEKSPLLPPKVRKQIARLHTRLDHWLQHDDVPRLVHWDIWSTNLLARPDPDGKWRIAALLDPNCKFAHAEAEIAYLELFRTITPAFLKTYQSIHRLSGNYSTVRRPIYQLYPLINHVHLFGQEYVKPLLGAVERVAPLL